MTQKITLINPHHGVAWNRMLDCMITDMPRTTRILYSTGKLFDCLDRFIAMITVYRGQMQNAGTPKTEAELILLRKVIPDGILEKENNIALSQQYVDELKNTIADLPEVIKEIEV
jgi:hypothetical protein